jgi:hypothetical protein
MMIAYNLCFSTIIAKVVPGVNATMGGRTKTGTGKGIGVGGGGAGARDEEGAGAREGEGEGAGALLDNDTTGEHVSTPPFAQLVVFLISTAFVVPLPLPFTFLLCLLSLTCLVSLLTIAYQQLFH